ncbi:Cytochrome oxidase Cu insertion factor, SCO1/SenC/PrrC family [bacterium A37T11]|nr:Cytochrome oxidase Cu insertion factor, SCO1/SenC/PrrC family [bacterium A37T11]
MRKYPLFFQFIFICFTYIGFSSQFAHGQAYHTAHISGHVDLPGCDTLVFVLTRCPTIVVDQLSYEEKNVLLDAHGRFNIRLDSLTDPFYYSLFPVVGGQLHRPITRGDQMLGMPGDSVDFEIGSASIRASGRGCNKYNVHFQYDSILYSPGGPEPKAYAEDMDTLILYRAENYYDSIYQQKKAILDLHKNELTAQEYQLMAADLKMGRRQFDFTMLIGGLILSPINVYRTYLAHLFWRKNAAIDTTDWQTATYSGKFCEIIFNSMLLKELLSNKDNMDKGKVKIENLYYRIRNHYNGLLKEKLLIGLLSRYSTRENLPQYLDAMEPYITTPILKKELEDYRELNLSTQKNALVRYFSFTDSLGNKVDSTNLLGHITLVDLWYTGCGACAKAKNRLTPLLTDKLINKRFQLISISIDDQAKWKISLKKGIYTHPSGINTFTDGLRDQHPFIDYYKISGYPAFFLIDEKGKIICRTQLVNEIEELLKKI